MLRRDRPYFRYGDRLLLKGALRSPTFLEDFDYPAYLAPQGIGSVMSFPGVTLLGDGEAAAFYRWLYGARWRMADSLARTVPEPQASLDQAIHPGLHAYREVIVIYQAIMVEFKRQRDVVGLNHVHQLYAAVPKPGVAQPPGVSPLHDVMSAGVAPH